MPAPTWDGSTYIKSEGLEYRNLKFERRPIWVIKLTQLDPNYVYGHRIFYVDKETLMYWAIENYDQKGRLYRVNNSNYGFVPEIGSFTWHGGSFFLADYIDLHSGIQTPFLCPATFSRGDISLKGLLRKAT
jgi:uncharacterized protein DUF1329